MNSGSTRTHKHTLGSKGTTDPDRCRFFHRHHDEVEYVTNSALREERQQRKKGGRKDGKERERERGERRGREDRAQEAWLGSSGPK